MRCRGTWLLIVVAAVGSAEAFASNPGDTGNELLSALLAGEKMVAGEALDDLQRLDATYALGFVVGAWEMGVAAGIFGVPSSNVSHGQVCKVVVKYLKNHPEKLHEGGLLLIMDSLFEAFPPKRKTTKSE